MSNELPSASEKTAILDLLDDSSSVVRKAIIKRLEELGPDGKALLQEGIDSPNRLLSWHARWYLTELQRSNPIERFRAFINSQNYELETGSLLLCRIVNPELDIGKFCSELDRIADRCRELLIEPTTLRENCLVMNRVLFHELGFRGNSENYNDPANSFLDQVLFGRKGLPITLSILYILVGRRIGAELDPVGIPGHFLVGSFEEEKPFYVDPYERGKFWTSEQLMERIEETNPQTHISHLAPTSIRETLCRCCRNLVNHYTLDGQIHMAKLFRSFVEDFVEIYHRQASS